MHTDTMHTDANAELHARPSLYFAGPALVEHLAFMCVDEAFPDLTPATACGDGEDGRIRYRIERHTEILTVTRVVTLVEQPDAWPVLSFSRQEAEAIAGLSAARLVHRVAILVVGPAVAEPGESLRRFRFGVSAGSYIGGRGAQVFSDFRIQPDGSNRMLVFNHDLNAYRLGRMVRRLYEIETYRSMALLGLPEARALGPALVRFDADLVALSGEHTEAANENFRDLLDAIASLSAQVVSAASRTRHRFGATAAYASIVEDRISELREERIPGFERFGVFVNRRFKPAVRTCQATAVRLEQLSQAAVLLVDLLQTRVQVEVQDQSVKQMRIMTERAAVQLKIQRAVEGLSIIAITYYVVALWKSATEALAHAGFEVDPRISLAIIPLALLAVTLAVLRVRRALTE